MSSFFNALVIVAAMLLGAGVSERSGQCSGLVSDVSPTLSCAMVPRLNESVATERLDVDEAEPEPAVSDATTATQVLGAAASLGEGTETTTPATARKLEVPAAHAATERQQAAASAARPIETTDRAEPDPEAQRSTTAAATRDAQRRAFRSAEELAEAAALAETLAARLTEERRALGLARQAVAAASGEAAASTKAAEAARAAARRAAAEAEPSRMTSQAEKIQLSQAQQRNVRIQREIADAVARASAHEEALRALQRHADQRAEAVAEARRQNVERDAAAAVVEQAAKVNQARLEAAETREAALRRAVDALETRAASRRAELDAAERAAAATDRAISAVEERVARLEVRSTAAATSLARESARLSEVSAASEEPLSSDAGEPAGAPASLLAYAETVSPLLPAVGTIAVDTGGDSSERPRLATPLQAEPSPMADGRGGAGAIGTDVTGAEEAGGLEPEGSDDSTLPQVERPTGTDRRNGAPAAEGGSGTAEDVPGARLALRPQSGPPEVEGMSALPPANPLREDTFALASYGDTDVMPLAEAAPVFSAEGIGSVSISAPHATLRFAMAEGVEAELAFGGPDDYDRVAAAVTDAGAVLYSRAFENAFVTSGVDDAVDDPGYYTLGLMSSGRSVIVRLRFAATPAEGARQAVRDVVNAVACSALFGYASLPCREQQIRTTAARQ